MKKEKVYFISEFFLNSFSIRSVITNPPTTLKVAIAIAITPITLSKGVVSTEKSRSAPSMVTAEIAFVIDIKGVCKSCGTFDIKRYPIKKQKKNTNSIINSSAILPRSPVSL